MFVLKPLLQRLRLTLLTILTDLMGLTDPMGLKVSRDPGVASLSYDWTRPWRLQCLPAQQIGGSVRLEPGSAVFQLAPSEENQDGSESTFSAEDHMES